MIPESDLGFGKVKETDVRHERAKDYVSDGPLIGMLSVSVI